MELFNLRVLLEEYFKVQIRDLSAPKRGDHVHEKERKEKREKRKGRKEKEEEKG